MITLYGNPLSPNSRRAHWALEEVQQPYTFKALNLQTGEQKAPDYVALNPNARVPTLKDGDFVMWESAAIALYLSEKYAAGKLMPQESAARGTVYQWISWNNTDLGPAISKPAMMKLFASFGAPFDAGAHEQAVHGAQPLLKIVNSALEGKKHLAGNDFSVADIVVGETLSLCDLATIDLAPFPNVAAYLRTLGERPAYKKTRPQLG